LCIISGQTNSAIKHKQVDSLSTLKINIKQKDTIFFEIPDNGLLIEWDDKPKFPGGEKALINYVNENTIYPLPAIKDSIEGKVLVRFAVDVDGSTNNIQIFRSVRDDIDNECIRVVKAMPKWEPGLKLNKSDKGFYWTKAKWWYSISFTFSLSNHESKKGIIIKPR